MTSVSTPNLAFLLARPLIEPAEWPAASGCFSAMSAARLAFLICRGGSRQVSRHLSFESKRRKLGGGGEEVELKHHEVSEP
jgi:hypothetical protein